MPIYKNNVKYDFGYQVDTGECHCDAHPNTLEKIGSREEEGYAAPFEVDNSWLPYIQITSGEVNFANRPFINCIKTLYIASNDVPVKFSYTEDMATVEQYYINNNACRWGSVGHEDALRDWCGREDMYRSKAQNRTFGTFIDEQTTQWTEMLHTIRALVKICWVPNGNVGSLAHGGTRQLDRSVVINASDITGPGAYTEDNVPEYIYLTDTLYENLFNGKNNDWKQNWDLYFDDKVITYDATETEWLENYFTLNTNKVDYPWYTSQITCYYGKYIRLKEDNSVVAELPYWRQDKKFVDVEPNLTNQNVTRQVSVTFNGETKTEELTLGPAEPTMTVRMYINTENGQYDMFSLWPFRFSDYCSNWSDDWTRQDFSDSDVMRSQAMYSLIKKIRYKYVGDSEWTDVTLPEYKDIVYSAYNDHSSQNRIEWWPAVQLTQDGYIDIEYYFSFNKYVKLYDKDGTTYLYMMNLGRDAGWSASRFYNNKYKSQEPWNTSVDVDVNNTETPWIKSFDISKQYWNWFFHDLSVDDATKYIGDPAYGRNIRTASYHDFKYLRNSDQNWLMANGWYTGVTDIVMDNLTISRHENKNFWNTDNDGSRDYLTVWYVNPVRQPFNDWFLGVNPRPKVVYLHPTIYNMMNHGFISGCYEYEGEYNCWDDHDPDYNTFKGIPEGWNYTRLQQFLEDGGEIRELPQNWKELVPDYLGK